MVSTGRIAGYWLLIIAAVGSVSGSAWAQPNGQQKAYGPAAQKADLPPSPPPAQNLTAKNPKPYEPACSAPKDRGENELCESIRANDLAAKNLFWVRIGTGAVLLSLVFTAWAAWAAAVAAGAARKSVEHAEADASEQRERFSQQLEIARNTALAAQAGVVASKDEARLRLRAYVMAGELSVKSFMAGRCPVVSYTIMNRGHTPARVIRLAYGRMFYRANEDFKFRSVTPSINFHMGPGQRQSGDLGIDEPIPQEAVAKIADGTWIMTLAGYVVYQDVFGVTRRTVFRGDVSVAALDENGDGPLVIPNKHVRSS